MTSKLFPATKIDLDPGFSRLGAALHESGSSEVKKCPKKQRIIIDSTRKMQLFCEKSRISGGPRLHPGKPSMPKVHPDKPEIHPDKPQLTHYVGPPPEIKKQEDVIVNFS